MYEFTDEECDVLIRSLHLTMDAYVEMSDDLSKSTKAEDIAEAQKVERILDVCETVRKKLGDTWEPSPEYRVPDSPEDLT